MADLGTALVLRLRGFAIVMLPKVGALHLGRAEKLLPRSRQRDPAALHDVAAVGDLQRLARVLLDEQDGPAFRAQLAKGEENAGDELGREPQRRLVKQQEP